MYNEIADFSLLLLLQVVVVDKLYLSNVTVKFIFYLFKIYQTELLTFFYSALFKLLLKLKLVLN